MTTQDRIDSATRAAAQAFIARIAHRYDLAETLLFGSRARRDHDQNSDADVAVVLHGPHMKRFDVVRDMSAVAFDVMLETGILIQPVPLWESEWQHPEQFSNPDLLENIRRDGVRL